MKISFTALDRHPLLLGLPGAYYDLEKDRVFQGDRSKFLTKSTGVMYDPRAQDPLWNTFIDSVFSGDEEMIRFVQRLLGYTLTGLTQPNILPVFSGSGSNGKGTLIHVVARVMGDYSTCLRSDLLLTRPEGHPTEFSTLFGARFAHAQETDQNRALNESLIKTLTGGDPLTTRRTFEKPLDARSDPQTLLGHNHLPNIQGTDHGIWRRVLVIPFERQFHDTGENTTLKARLSQPSVLATALNWMLEGTREFLRVGLLPPSRVTAETSKYREQEDVLGEFLAETVTQDPEGFVSTSDLLAEWSYWSKRRGLKPIDNRTLAGAILAKFGLKGKSDGRRRGYRGIRIMEYSEKVDAEVEPNSRCNHSSDDFITSRGGLMRRLTDSIDSSDTKIDRCAKLAVSGFTLQKQGRNALLDSIDNNFGHTHTLGREAL